MLEIGTEAAGSSAVPTVFAILEPFAVKKVYWVPDRITPMLPSGHAFNPLAALAEAVITSCRAPTVMFVMEAEALKGAVAVAVTVTD
jgi:uncharacterized membrane protein YjjB (DUF3815 family)